MCVFFFFEREQQERNRKLKNYLIIQIVRRMRSKYEVERNRESAKIQANNNEHRKV